MVVVELNLGGQEFMRRRSVGDGQEGERKWRAVSRQRKECVLRRQAQVAVWHVKEA